MGRDTREIDEVGNLTVLDSEHAEAFKQALARILATEVAELTYAEILDGLPTTTSFLEFSFWQEGHPVFELNHETLCPGAVEKTRAFRDRLDPLHLVFPLSVSCAARSDTPMPQRRVPLPPGAWLTPCR